MTGANSQARSASTTTLTPPPPPRYVQYAYTVRGGTPLARTWSVAGLPHHNRTLLVPIASIIETLLAPGVPMIDDSRITDVATQLAANSLHMLAGSDRLAYLKWTRERQLAQLQGATSLFRRDEVGHAKPPTLRVPPHTGGAVTVVAVEDVGKVVDAVRRAEPRRSAEAEEDVIADVPVELRRFDAVHLVDPAARQWATATLGTVFNPDPPPPPAPAPPALLPTPPAAAAAAAAPRTEPDRDDRTSGRKDADDADREPAPSGSDVAPAFPTSPRGMGAQFSAADHSSPPHAMAARPTTVLDVLDQRGAAPSSSSSITAAAVATPPTWARPPPPIPSARSPTPTPALACSAPALASDRLASPQMPALAFSAPSASGLLDDSPVLYVSDDPSPSAAGNRWPDATGE
ncbi:hypothetical protein AMAG_18905 [Allomyces macrogynus ATCC 38327]|uniref:Uncharacterized protein n=1 Tax=Allomyces macrogynus (strain ATCC 38327) TaxID=578462 RepID=A0A0L0SJQ6_ALLM3|nr:hypothetical protein AMAG_18905 [Allomyces macrogynus ATCC 38327]|eukprot:KNE62716.1 hypothetical protein AMAG_18905 [Allomyces macrogynus ATCC 38327]